ncbi:MAG: SsrA-binding protein SmpB [Candidatus Sungbacteria bacterium]|uniref:SsrA-binding protein n=1 Tax=Candidatus Sungiibacteriota bacterium TaxID=2750080 RepID=A0A932QYH2_9BACT|nr:SsrA-binding protein SmpB [Candidatus Sungbacteria bacterium]
MPKSIAHQDLSVNRRAYFDYQILRTYEAGLELRGFEVKAIKNGHVNLAGAFAVIRGNEAWLLNATIPAHQPKNAPADYDPQRTRRLLLHKSEIKELIGAAAQRGLTIVPLKVYAAGSRIKILLGLARHKKKGDRREIIKRRESEREIARTLKRG